MAEKGRITLNEIEALEVDADPSVFGVKAEVGSLAIRDSGGVWQKTGPLDTDWTHLSPRRKSGRVTAGLFSGNPKKFALNFTTPFPDNNYEVSLGSSADARVLTYESKLATGFTINTNANQALVGEVSWAAAYDDETV